MDPSHASGHRNADTHTNVAPSASRESAQSSLDLDAILAEVEALTGKVAALTPSEIPTETTTEPHEQLNAANTGTEQSQQAAGVDFALLEREIASLLSADAPVQSTVRDEVTQPATPVVHAEASSASVTSEALAARSSDPMLQEIEQLLDDTNDAVLKRTNGDLNAALESVFDPQALAGQEEDVHRALIEAFGTSRRASSSFSPAAITNPAPKFEGVSRAVPPELHAENLAEPSVNQAVPLVSQPVAAKIEASSATSSAMPTDTARETTQTFEQIAAASSTREPIEYAGEKPFEAAFPSVSVPSAHSGTQASTTTASSVAREQADLSQESVATPQHAQKPRIFVWGSLVARALFRTCVKVAKLPLVFASLPMRVVPSNAQLYVSAVALASALAVPLAWWLAYTASNKPGIGRVQFSSLSETESAQHDVAPPAVGVSPPAVGASTQTESDELSHDQAHDQAPPSAASHDASRDASHDVSH